MEPTQFDDVDEASHQPLQETVDSADRSGDFFSRLLARGIDYNEIKRIVTRSIPQATLFHQRQFGNRSASRVLGEFDRRHKLLSRETLLSPEEKQALQQPLRGKELIACNALLEDLFSQRSQWVLRTTIVPSGGDEDGRPLYIHPGVNLVAKHRDTGQQFDLCLNGTELCDVRTWACTWKKAFESLRSLGVALEAGDYKRLTSAHEAEGWPLFTKYIIPQLYAYLIPFFPSKAHHSDGADSGVAGGPQRCAMYSKEVLETIVEILRREHPDVFASTTVARIRAVIQRHLEGRRKMNTDFVQKPQTTKTVSP